MVLCLEPNGQGDTGELMISNIQPCPLALGLFVTHLSSKTEWLKSPQIGIKDDSGFGQCSSHVLDLKGSQTMEEGFVQKGNNRHAGPLPLSLGALCGCTAKVFVAYSLAKTHRAGESRKRALAKSGRGTTAITQNLPRNSNTSISIL